jgi:hypothetical protein
MQAFTLDKESLKSLANDALHSVGITVLLLLVDFAFKALNLVHFSDPTVAGAYALVVQLVYNTG